MTLPDAQDEFERSSDRYWFPKTLIRFFVLLPDPLPTPDRFVYIRSAPLMPWDIEKMEGNGTAVEIPGRSWLDNLSDQTAWHPVEDQRLIPNTGGLNNLSGYRQGKVKHVGRHQVQSISRLWNGSYKDSGIFERLHPPLQTITRLKEVIAEKLEEERWVPPETASNHDYTVAEIVVPRFDHSNPDPSRGIQVSFQFALDCVRHIQTSLYMVQRIPFRLATQETVEPTVNYEVGTVSASSADSPDFPVEEWRQAILQANVSPSYTGRPTALDQDELRKFDDALIARLTAAPLHEYLELRRRAHVALDRNGDYNESVIWSAAAAEYLLDELLRLMFWEVGSRPEDCVSVFKSLSVAARVKANYTAIAGSAWDLKTPGPIVNWLNDVASVRNHIVHDIRQVERKHAELAMDTVDALVSHICDLVSANLAKYRRTAFALLGRDGLTSRGKLQQFLELGQVTATTPEPDWEYSFSGWRATHRRLVKDIFTPRASDESRSSLIFGFGRRHRGYWVLADPLTQQVIKADVDESTINELQRKAIVDALDSPDHPEWQGTSAVFHGVSVLKTHKPWREQHDYMPLNGAIVDGHDIPDKVYVWRPSWSPQPPAR